MAAYRPPPPSYSVTNAARMYQNHTGASSSNNDSTRILASKANSSIKKELEKKLQVEDDSNRQEMESFADYYAIIRTMEKLETQYIRGTIAPDVYEKECQKLLPRFSTLKECLPSDMQNPAMAIPTFMSRYQLKAARAANRFATGVPATCSAGGGEDSSKIALFVAEAVQGFITLMDSLRLGMTAVDQVHPLTADVVNALNKIAQLPADFEPKMKVKSWLQILSAMRATEVLDENQTREFLRDMENSHQTFVHWLQSRNT